MKLTKIFAAMLALGAAMIIGATDARAQSFELKDGDRVVFLGDTFIEREQHYGWIELMLTTRFADRNVTFRNIGWSADTPAGDSRFGLSLLQAGNEPADEGWRMLQKQIEETKPTVVFLGYGMASSFDGQAGLERFKADYNRLLDTIQKISPGARFVFLGPIKHEQLPAPWPDAKPHNEQLKAYSAAIAEIAKSRQAPFVSLLETKPTSDSYFILPAKLTENGIILTDAGYRTAAKDIEKSLLGSNGAWVSSKAIDPLRQVILRKNEWYFHRSRPANMAYIFGFRKKEQGRNAVEIPQFDPLIEIEEKKIAALRKLNITNPPADLQPAKPREGAAAAKFTEQPKPNFTVADNLEVTLWAENPLLRKPIQMNFDPQGRLWVASSEVYPQIEPGQAATDKIIILEDTKGSGKADKATVFADGLLLPTGLEPGDNGVYVAQSTELLHLKDTNGDGKADQKRIVLSSFGTEDTHHNLHTLHWGHDGRLYLSQSIYTRSDVETPHGVIRLKSGGVFQLDTRDLRMDILFRGWINSWGHQFDAYGQSFLTDGAGGQGINFGVPDAMYVTYARARRILGSVSPGNYPKFAGLEIVQSENFPADWQGSMITCDFRAHRVVHFGISDQGSAYVTKELPDIMRTTSDSFRPIDVKMGPDGAIYIADWSNPIIQHGEVDFRDPRRDHAHGRIWRITYKGGKTVKAPELVKATNKELFAQLISPNSFNEKQARRVLEERGADKVAKDLATWTRQEKDEKALLEALWLHQTFNISNRALLEKLLAAKDGNVRAAAVRVLSEWAELNLTGGDTAKDLALLEKAVADDNARVRLEAVRALSQYPGLKAADLALSVLTKPMDGFLEYALWLTINDLAKPWLEAVKSGAWNVEGREQQLEYGLKAVEPALASEVLAGLFAQKHLPQNGSGPWIELIGQAGGPAELRNMFDQLLKGEFVEPAAIRVFQSLGEAARLRNVRPSGDLAQFAPMLKSPSDSIRTAAMRLAGAWKVNAFIPQLLETAGNVKSSAAVRTAAFDALRDLGAQPPVVNGLKNLTAATQPADIRRQAVVTFAGLNLNSALPSVIELLKSTTNDAEAQALWRALLGIRNGAPRLAAALQNEALPKAVAATGLRVAREGAQNQELVPVLIRLAGLTVSDKELTTAELQAIAAEALQKGDAARGERIYRRAELACAACHSIGGAGGKVGPDMTSIGASAPADYLVESVLYPNRKIKEGFHSILVTTKDEQEFSGILVRENDRELVVRNAANQEVSVAKSNIAQRRNGASLMPSGLVDALLPEERLDLIKFLSMLGKPGDYDASKGSSPRYWRIYTITSPNQHLGVEPVIKGDFTLKDWVPLYARVSGALPKDDVLSVMTTTRNIRGVFAATQFTSAKGGAATFTLKGGPIVGAWLNGQPVKLGASTKLTPATGLNTLVIQLGDDAPPEVVQLNSTDVSFLAN
jgi:putative heme-binding domain-containing protein